MAEPSNSTTAKPSLLDRLLNLFSEVRAGESPTVLLMMVNVFLVLTAYYVIKTVREPLIVSTGGAEAGSYAAAVQALVLVPAVPAYAWFAKKVDTNRLVLGVTLFFFVCLELFYLGAFVGVPYLGFIFFVWVGIFSLMMIAQFWSFANDLYSKSEGERLFPIVAIGASAGAPVGSLIAGRLFKLDFGAFNMLQVAAAILLVHLGLYIVVQRRERGRAGADEKSEEKKSDEGLGGPNGFTLVFQSGYLRLIALLLILLNLVNTTGEYILRQAALSEAQKALLAEDPSVAALIADPEKWTQPMKDFVEKDVGTFYGDFFFWVNIAGLVIQSVVVSRIVKYVGIAGVLLALPIIALGTYGLVAVGVGFVVLRWAKTAENSTDYSVMNTAKAMLWLPTTREQKYKGKQAVDTFFVRLGDVLSAGVVAGGLALGFGPRGFGATNLVLIAAWLVVAFLLIREYKRLSSAKAEAEEPAKSAG